MVRTHSLSPSNPNPDLSPLCRRSSSSSVLHLVLLTHELTLTSLAPFLSILHHISRTLSALRSLVTAWSTETESAISRSGLHYQALKGHRSPWYYLQYRATALMNGTKTSGEMRLYLAKGLEKFVHSTRKCACVLFSCRGRCTDAPIVFE
jgi:hypothetical protein